MKFDPGFLGIDRRSSGSFPFYREHGEDAEIHGVFFFYTMRMGKNNYFLSLWSSF